MTKKEIKEQLIQKLIRGMLKKTKAKRTVIKRKKVARKIDSPIKRVRYTTKLSVKKLNSLLNDSVALSNKSGDMFRVSQSSKNIFTLTNIRTNTSIIYFKKDSIFREGMVHLNCADTTVDSYKVLGPIGLK